MSITHTHLCFCSDECLSWPGKIEGLHTCWWRGSWAVLWGWWIDPVCVSFLAGSEHLFGASVLCSQQNGRWQLPICLSSGLFCILLPTLCPTPLAHSQFISESEFCSHRWLSCGPPAFLTCTSQTIFLWLWVSRGEGANLISLCVCRLPCIQT